MFTIKYVYGATSQPHVNSVDPDQNAIQFAIWNASF